MWVRSHSKVYQGIAKQQVWKLWTDIDKWPLWNPDLEYCKLEQPFEIGSSFILKPKGAPKVVIFLQEVKHEKMFTDCTKFFGAKMYGKHEMHIEENGLRLTTTITVTGVLRHLWIKLVVKDIAAKLPKQMDNLVNLL